MANKRQKTDVVIGAFYQRSANSTDVVFTVAGGGGQVHGYDARMKSFAVTDATVLGWTALAVNDFPNSPDPRLPYVYDLHWDIKRISQLQYLSSEEKLDVARMLVQEFGVSKPFDNIDTLATVVRLRNDIKNGYTQEPEQDNAGPRL